MDLTRDAAGVALRPRGIPATVARGAGAALAAVGAARYGRSLGPAAPFDGASLLGERAAFLPPTSPSSSGTSRGGRARFIRARDGWWVLHLARESDVDLVPALVESEVGGADDLAASWAAVVDWSATVTSAHAVERAVLLGLPAALPGETRPPDLPWSVETSTPACATGPAGTARRVVNLGALWAGPLAAHLLGELGFDVLHVEATDRPDAARWGDPGLYELLHRGSRTRVIDFASASGRRELRDLVATADVVIEASRPRAFETLGIAWPDIVADGRARTWLQITGHGREQPLRVGFGDDAAVAGGLLAEHDDGTPTFAGDAVADPLTGLIGALAVAGLQADDRATRISVALAGVAAWCRATGDPDWPAVLPPAAAPRRRGHRGTAGHPTGR